MNQITKEQNRKASAFSDIPDKVSFVLSVAGGTRHSGRHLSCHLFGTYELLAAWGCTQELCDAGLFHSIYGTQAYSVESVPLASRDIVKSLIGSYGEHLVFVFSQMAVPSFITEAKVPGIQTRTVLSHASNAPISLSVDDFRSLSLLLAANAIEQIEDIPASRKADVARSLIALKPFVNSHGRLAISAVVGKVQG